MSQFIKFYFTSSVLDKPRTFLLDHHIGRVFLFQCVLEFQCGWLGWYPCGRLKHKLCFSLPHGYHPNQPHRNSQHTSKQEHMTNVVIQ